MSRTKRQRENSGGIKCRCIYCDETSDVSKSLFIHSKKGMEKTGPFGACAGSVYQFSLGRWLDTAKRGNFVSHIKRHLEAEAERLCTCGAGCSLDPDDHEAWCKSKKYIKETMP